LRYPDSSKEAYRRGLSRKKVVSLSWRSCSTRREGYSKRLGYIEVLT
jgi:hypothetical protein